MTLNGAQRHPFKRGCSSSCQEAPAGTLGYLLPSRLLSDKSWELPLTGACSFQAQRDTDESCVLFFGPTQSRAKLQGFEDNSQNTCTRGLLCLSGVCWGQHAVQRASRGTARPASPAGASALLLLLECVIRVQRSRSCSALLGFPALHLAGEEARKPSVCWWCCRKSTQMMRLSEFLNERIASLLLASHLKPSFPSSGAHLIPDMLPFTLGSSFTAVLNKSGAFRSKIVTLKQMPLVWYKAV